MHTEVGAHRLLDLRAIGDQHPRQRAEQLVALLQRRERIGEERCSLAFDDLVELSDRGGVVGCRSSDRQR